MREKPMPAIKNALFLMIFFISLFLLPDSQMQDKYTFEGHWKNTQGYLSSSRLVVTLVKFNENSFRANFTGLAWDHRKEFSYDLILNIWNKDKKGTKARIRGTTMVDGEQYTWSGYFNQKQFFIRYNSTNNTGSARLYPKKK